MGAPADVLQRVPLLKGLPEAELNELAARFRERAYDRGAPVVSRGSSGAGFFVIAEGEAEVSSHGQHRRDLGRGDHFGEIALITDTDRTATIRAKTDLRCFGMTSWEFKPLVESNGAIAWKLLQSMGRMLSG